MHIHLSRACILRFAAGCAAAMLALAGTALAGPPTAPCQVGDLVFMDLNANGLQDRGEPGLNGVVLHLVDHEGTIAATTVSARGPMGQNGWYTFTLTHCDATYAIVAETPAGLAPALPCSMDAHADGDSNCSGTLVDLGDGSARIPPGWLSRWKNGWPPNLGRGLLNWSNRTIDFGFVNACDGLIGDVTWSDLNRNGLQDEGEPGIDGVKVILKDMNGAVIRRTMSGATPAGAHGAYLFDHLCAGNYTVEAITPEGLDPAAPCSTDPAIDLGTDSNCSGTLVVLDTDESVNPAIDFGFVTMCPGGIGDLVWLDSNKNGIQDPGEPGIDGVTVTLKDQEGAVLKTTTSGPTADGRHGLFAFHGLCAGAYFVEVTTPATLAPSVPCSTEADPALGSDSNCPGTAVTLAADDTVNRSLDFGFTTTCLGRIGDLAWNDLDGNGLQDTGEPGLDGVPVTLHFPDQTTSITIPTGPDGEGGHGFYLFDGLCAGTWTVDFKTPAGFDPTAPCSLSADPLLTADSSCAGIAVTFDIDDGTNLAIDFGFQVHVQETGEGCSHGYWKQPQHSGAWPAPYTPDTPFATVFEDAFPGRTLVEVLWQGGGGLSALGRETVAALLNAASPLVAYDLDPQAVIDRFNAAYPGSKDDYNRLKDQFEGLSTQYCPLGAGEDDHSDPGTMPHGRSAGRGNHGQNKHH